MGICLFLPVVLALGATQVKHQPVIWADVPDISMVRVGKEYYMSSTTMHMSPGLPIMKSTDLVNWKMASYAYDTLGDNEALTLTNGKNAYGKGTWASSIRYHKGTFYVSTFSQTTGKSYIYSTKNPNKGPWKQVSAFSPSIHDHSLFFEDDGRVFLIHGVGNIRITELKEDLSGVKPGGVDQVLFKISQELAGPKIGLHGEGSQVVKHEGKYYVFNITWPQGGMRTQLVHRADSLLGQYEGKVFVKHEGIAQGSIIDSPNGKWYAYLFGDRGAVGRIPYIFNMHWENGWPVADLENPVGTIDHSMKQPKIVSSDEFRGKSLGLAWQWNHNPDNSLWSLSERTGWLRLRTGRVDQTVLQARNTLTQRTFGPKSRAATKLDVSAMKDGDVAGLMLLQGKYGYVGVKQEGGQRKVVMVNAGSGKAVEAESIPVDKTNVHFRVECDFLAQRDQATFYYSLDGKKWTQVGDRLQLRYELSHFMGARFGLFNVSTSSPGGHVDFDYLRLD